MPPLMSYRLIILNGERRGERVEVGPSTLTIGRDPGCGLHLSDPDIKPLHAELIPTPDSLRIRAGDEALVTVNGTPQREGVLGHGDVVDLGPTRFFIHASAGTLSWEGLTGPRHLRITIGVALVLLAGGLIWWALRNPTPTAPDPGTVPIRPSAAALSNAAIMAAAILDDNTVTGTPRIVIHPSISRSFTPQEINDALHIMAQRSVSTVSPDLTIAQAELEYATRYLEEKAKSNTVIQTGTEQRQNSADLTRAESALRELPPATVTNVTLPEVIPDTTPNPAAGGKPAPLP